MANRVLLLCLLILCSSIYVSQGKGSSGRSRGGSSWGKGWGGGSSSSGGSSSWSSGSSYKPSSSLSSWSSWSSYKPSSSYSSGSSYRPSSSSSGSSWWGSSSSSGSHRYPSSTGLYGSNSGSHTYPSSTGLSGTGFDSGSWTGSHGYPSSPGLSGSNKPLDSATPHTWHTSSSSRGSTYFQPPIIQYPQNVYVTQYRDSGSKYRNLLTGLTYYNFGRSHSHYYHDHYYYDDYYRHRYYDNYNSNSGSGYRQTTQDRPKDEAVCSLRIVENGKTQLLKIPCEIVSTFTESGKKLNTPVETTINKTICSSNSTVYERTTPETEQHHKTVDEMLKYLANDTTKITSSFIQSIINSKHRTNATSVVNATSFNTTTVSITSVANVTVPVRIENNVTEGNKTIYTVCLITATEEIINVTVCITDTTLNTTDPLKVKGRPIDLSRIECSVDIKTTDAYIRNNIDCNTLMQYAKKPLTVAKPNGLMPERQKLKQWLNKPPWWMSMFIAV